MANAANAAFLQMDAASPARTATQRALERSAAPGVATVALARTVAPEQAIAVEVAGLIAARARIAVALAPTAPAAARAVSAVAILDLVDAHIRSYLYIRINESAQISAFPSF